MRAQLDHMMVLEKSWLRTLPRSRIGIPYSHGDRLKYIFWRFYTPWHPLVRDIALGLRIIRGKGRHEYLLGKIADHLTLKEFITFLVEEGYGRNSVAWKEEGEVASLRYALDFKYQYHVRIFEDREVRAHYEYTPECYPIAHLRRKNMEDRRNEFLTLFGDRIIPL